ncbi:MAG: hypothetical protein DMF96_13825 [Acidobacteria bacterium]|nr:MAG: hypothetical protein DMF96_13825 [Acidobacteriota bacterium]
MVIVGDVLVAGAASIVAREIMAQELGTTGARRLQSLCKNRVSGSSAQRQRLMAAGVIWEGTAGR